MAAAELASDTAAVGPGLQKSGSESLGVWHWGDGSYQPGASNWQGPGEPQMETHSLISFTGPGLIFTFPNHKQTCGDTVGA